MHPRSRLRRRCLRRSPGRITSRALRMLLDSKNFLENPSRRSTVFRASSRRLSGLLLDDHRERIDDLPVLRGNRRPHRAAALTARSRSRAGLFLETALGLGVSDAPQIPPVRSAAESSLGLFDGVCERRRALRRSRRPSTGTVAIVVKHHDEGTGFILESTTASFAARRSTWCNSSRGGSETMMAVDHAASVHCRKFSRWARPVARWLFAME